MSDIDFCFGCKFAQCCYDQGPSGRMLIRCSAPVKPDLTLYGSQDMVEEKYNGCPNAEPLDLFKGEFEGAARAKARLFKNAAERGDL